MKKGTLFLVPVTLGQSDPHETIPQPVLDRMKSLRNYIVEDIRSARRFLRLIDPGFPIDDTWFLQIDKHAKNQSADSFLKPLLSGYDTGLMSEAGMPGIADPGSFIVAEAHRNKITVKPLSGPSSILLALIASGMNGQAFRFHGYLPLKQSERITALKSLEAESAKGESQIFMETPYRNQKLFDDMLANCHPSTTLTVAAALTLENESIKTMSISEWKKESKPPGKVPAVFILGKAQ